jgi:hypothetical protein
VTSSAAILLSTCKCLLEPGETNFRSLRRFDCGMERLLLVLLGLMVVLSLTRLPLIATTARSFVLPLTPSARWKSDREEPTGIANCCWLLSECPLLSDLATCDNVFFSLRPPRKNASEFRLMSPAIELRLISAFCSTMTLRSIKVASHDLRAW